MIQQALQAVLAPLVAGKSFPNLASQDATPPYIVYQRVVSVTHNNLLGPSDLQNTRVQIDIYSRRISEAAQLETALEASLASWSVQNVPISSVDVYEEEVRAYRITKDYSIWSTNG